ncbi:MAG: metallophosphoesterase [Thermomicrobiales bacterium]
MNRSKRALSVGLIGSVATLAGAVAAYATWIAPRWLEIVRIKVAVPALPNEWIGLRIAHLSDFHAGGGVPLDLLRRAKAIALGDEPDIVALTGDFYNGGQVRDVGDLFSDWPGAESVVAVLGNHDHRGPQADQERLLDELSRAGVEVLGNRAINLPVRGLPAWIVGVDDPFSWKMDEEQAFSELPTEADALLYLAHSPVAATTLPVGRVRLMLAGHTHGGQVRLVPDGRIPFVSLARRLRGAPQRPDPELHRGLHWVRGAVLIISNGLGVSKLPWRFRTRPQVVLIELERASSYGPACDDARRYVRRLNPGPCWLRWLS